MATITTTQDGLLVVLTAKESRAMDRKATEAGTHPLLLAAAMLTEMLVGWEEDYTHVDGPKRLSQFYGLPVEAQARVDRILSGEE